MYSRILIAFDGSEGSFAALREAIAIASGQPGAVVRVVAVADIPPELLTGEGANLPAAEHRALDDARGAIARAAEMLAATAIHAETAVTESPGQSPAQVLLDEARQWNADLIVVGSHGRRGWRRLMLGSVAESVARGADRPVLIVHRLPDST